MKQAASLRPSKTWKAVTPPAGWTWSLPFTLQRRKSSFRVVFPLDLKTYANITVAKTYWVKQAADGGSDVASGADEAHALATFNAALSKADVDCVMVKAGVYDPGWNNKQMTRSVQVIGYGGPVITRKCAAALSWSPVGNHYEAAYATNIGSVIDAQNPDACGDYIPLVNQASSANVDATPGSWYYGSSTIYVRTLDSRQPDANIFCHISAANGRATNAVTLYLEGISFWGGSSPLLASLAVAGGKIYCKNCDFKYGSNTTATDAFTISGFDEVIMQNCISARNGGDGFKMQVSGSLAANLALINCTGRNNGMTNSTNANGYSRHGPGNTIVVGGSYFGNYGPNIKDINAGTLTWCLGVRNTTPACASANYNFAVGDASATPLLWLDTCASLGIVVKDLYAGPGAVIKYHNMTPSVPTFEGGGSVTSY